MSYIINNYNKPIKNIYMNGLVIEYILNGKRHREDGPAIIRYWDNGQILFEESYYINGVRHRLDGPAVIWYDSNGDIESEECFINGILQKKNEIL